MAELTYAQISECFNYDPYTGLFTWKERPLKHFSGTVSPSRYQIRFNRKFFGKAAFTSMDADGYLRAKVWGKSVKAHRVAWLLEFKNWPTMIDHINGDKTDNRIANLSLSNEVENGRNRRMNYNRPSGLIGVHWHVGCGRWIANIGIKGKLVHIGYFDDVADAIAARKEAGIKYGFSERHGS